MIETRRLKNVVICSFVLSRKTYICYENTHYEKTTFVFQLCYMKESWVFDQFNTCTDLKQTLSSTLILKSFFANKNQQNRFSNLTLHLIFEISLPFSFVSFQHDTRKEPQYLTLQCLVSTKRSHILKQICSFQLQVCLSVCELLVDTRHQALQG